MTRTARPRFAPLLLALTAACGGGTAPAPYEPVPLTPEARLERALSVEQPGATEESAIAGIEAELGPGPFLRALTAIALDSAATPLVRTNALLQLAGRQALTELLAFRGALAAGDPRVRAAAAIGLGRMLPNDEARVLPILERALADPDAYVQAKALEAVADASPDMLRRYIARDPATELRGIASELLKVAEERGAPLVGDGELSRETFSGARLTFRPRHAWDRWDAAVGELWLTPVGGQPVRISSDVEVVGNVVPAFFSPDGRYLVYESGRTIRVRDIEAASDREVAPGLAPRPLPFTSDFIYFRERLDQRDIARDRVSLSYDVIRAPYAMGAGIPIGTAYAEARQDVHGNYSPVRWARIREAEGSFVLIGDGLEVFPLPDPFAGSGSARE